jgi:hypothetical protein
VDLGPEGGDAGGHVVAVGTPEAMRPALGLDPRVAANPVQLHRAISEAAVGSPARGQGEA